MMTILRPIVFGLAALVAVLMAAPVSAQQAADTIYFGGDILTMEGKAPRYVEALAVKDGRITFAGAISELRSLEGAEHTRGQPRRSNTLARLRRWPQPHLLAC